jgi:hypothetical protein
MHTWSGDRLYEVVELNIESNPVRQTRVFRPDGNLSRANLPFLRGVLEPVVQKYDTQKASWTFYDLLNFLRRGGSSRR